MESEQTMHILEHDAVEIERRIANHDSGLDILPDFEIARRHADLIRVRALMRRVNATRLIS